MFKDQLKSVVAAWLVAEPFDEWLFDRFRSSHVATMDSVTAFNSISDAVEILFDQSDESAVIEITETLLSLAKASCTTEAPLILKDRKADLVMLFAKYGAYANKKLDDLFRYYRI